MFAPRCCLQAPWLKQRWGASDVNRVQAKSGIHSTRPRTGVRMVAEVPALDDRVKAVMEAEAALDAQSAQAQGSDHSLFFSPNSKRE